MPPDGFELSITSAVCDWDWDWDWDRDRGTGAWCHVIRGRQPVRSW